MPNGDELKEVMVRLEKLEKQVSAGGGKASAMAAVSADEVSAYHKVRAALWEDGSCGINETSPCVVQICRNPVCDRVCEIICRVCDTECTCGPCSVWGGRLTNLSRFGNLGG